MTHIPEFEKGTTVTIQTTVSDDTGAVVPPDNEEAHVTIEDLSTEELMVDNRSMEKVSSTQYEYDWQTTQGMSTGEYKVRTKADVSNDAYVESDLIKLVNIITQ